MRLAQRTVGLVTNREPLVEAAGAACVVSVPAQERERNGGRRRFLQSRVEGRAAVGSACESCLRRGAGRLAPARSLPNRPTRAGHGAGSVEPERLTDELRPSDPALLQQHNVRLLAGEELDQRRKGRRPRVRRRPEVQRNDPQPARGVSADLPPIRESDWIRRARDVAAQLQIAHGGLITARGAGGGRRRLEVIEVLDRFGSSSGSMLPRYQSR